MSHIPEQLLYPSAWPQEQLTAGQLPALKEAIQEYSCTIRGEYERLPAKQARDILLSEYNFRTRGGLKSCRPLGMTIYPGDVCYIDYGRAYISEIAYQHFGLVMNVFYGKAFVIPMTSNSHQFDTAYDPVENPGGHRHLMRLGRIEGLTRHSVLFLNDAKFINSARIIDVKGHIDPNGELYRTVWLRLMNCLHPGPAQ